MRFYPHSFVTSTKGRTGVLCLPRSGPTIEELREENHELRVMNEHLRKEVKELRKKQRERAVDGR